MKRLWTIGWALLALGVCAVAQGNDWSRDEFQLKFAFGAQDGAGGCETYIYIPPRAQRVRALLLLQQNVAEQMIAVHPAIRRACDANDIAIAWCRTPFDATWDLAGAGEVHDRVQAEFGRFGRSVGYPELGEVPMITFGHSATNAYCQNAAEAKPERVLAVIATHGWNGVDSFHNYRGPALLFIGHYWEQRQQIRSIGLNKSVPSLSKVNRKLETGWMPISVVEEYGSGHFDYSDRVVSVFAMFIDKAVKARLAPDGRLRDVDPASGWIASIPSYPGGAIPIKPYVEGSEQEKARSVWYFDRELAEAATGAITGSGAWDRACQMIGYAFPDGTPAPFGKAGLVNPVPYRIVPGTNELRLFPVRLTAFPEGFREAGQPLDVCSNPLITIEYVCGPYVWADAAGKYRMALNRGGAAGYLVARSPGDARVRPAVQPTRLVLSGEGGGPPPAFQPGARKPGDVIALPQGAPGGAYVGYYVDHGPARVAGGKLEILPLPAKTHGPLEVEVVPYTLAQGVSYGEPVRFSVGE